MELKKLVSRRKLTLSKEIKDLKELEYLNVEYQKLLRQIMDRKQANNKCKHRRNIAHNPPSKQKKKDNGGISQGIPKATCLLTLGNIITKS